MNNEHYLNYAVYMTSHGDYLVKVTGGYFASDAWMKGDDAYADVVGRKFGGIFGDDGKHSYCDKGNIRRLTSDEEFDKLWKSSCPLFKQNVIVVGALKKVHASRASKLSMSASFLENEKIYDFLTFGYVSHYCKPDEVPTEEEALNWAEWYLNKLSE